MEPEGLAVVPVGPCRPRAALTIPLRSAAPSPQQRPRVPMATRRAGAGPARRGRSRQRGADSMVAGRCSAPAVSTELRRCPLHARRRPCPPVPLPGRSRTRLHAWVAPFASLSRLSPFVLSHLRVPVFGCPILHACPRVSPPRVSLPPPPTWGSALPHPPCKPRPPCQAPPLSEAPPLPVSSASPRGHIRGSGVPPPSGRVPWGGGGGFPPPFPLITSRPPPPLG